MATYTEKNILAVLDKVQAGECWEWPDFGHLDYDTLTGPMVVLRDENRWAIVFCTVEWSTDHALTATVIPVGNCVQIPEPENFRPSPEDYAELGLGKREIKRQMKQQADYMARRLDTVQFDFDFDDESLAPNGYVRAVRVRGSRVDLSRLEIEPDDSRDPAFAVGLAVLKKYRNQILPNAAEAARFFAGDMPPVFMVIGEWHYSKWVRPSKTEVFQQLARALAKNDRACYASTGEPNTEWRIGVEPDWEDDHEEDVEDDKEDAKAEEEFLREFMTLPTEEEKKMIGGLISAMKAVTLSTAPVDREECIAAFSALYEAMGYPAPEFIFCSSPRDFQERAISVMKDAKSFSDVAGETLHFASYACKANPGKRDMKRIRGIGRYVSEQVLPFYELADCVKQAELACIPESLYWQAPRSCSTHNLADTSVERQVAHALGLSGDREMAMRTDRASYTCGGRDLYTRYCFIIDRPSRIVHPAFTPGAPEGRCRLEWRDGYAYEHELNEDE